MWKTGEIRENTEIDNPEYRNPMESKLTVDEIQNEIERIMNSGGFELDEITEGLDIDEPGDTLTEELSTVEPNQKYEVNGEIYETDDNGDIYKKNGKLLPDKEYTVNECTYKTDENGNKISCDANNLKYTADAKRNQKEQVEAGGEEREEDDDGGHIVARILGGAEGEENLVPMRRTINRGDYKKMENQIAATLKEGKDVSLHIDLEYEDSQRPSILRAEYTIDGKDTNVEFDNRENSTELIDSLDGKINSQDFNSLRDEIEDMKAAGIGVSLTSVKTEYDEMENPTKIIVGLLDESTGTKTYRSFYTN